MVRVVDGDTFTAINRDNLILKFRLYGIDAPERTQPFSKVSQQALATMIANMRVKVKVDSSDPWGRFVVKVEAPKVKDVSAELLRKGLAWHYKKFDQSEEYSAIEDKAKELRIGLWHDPTPTPPWEWRENKK